LLVLLGFAIVMARREVADLNTQIDLITEC
jgi:hypothetical protein